MFMRLTVVRARESHLRVAPCSGLKQHALIMTLRSDLVVLSDRTADLQGIDFIGSVLLSCAQTVSSGKRLNSYSEGCLSI